MLQGGDKQNQKEHENQRTLNQASDTDLSLYIFWLGQTPWCPHILLIHQSQYLRCFDLNILVTFQSYLTR